MIRDEIVILTFIIVSLLFTTTVYGKNNPLMINDITTVKPPGTIKVTYTGTSDTNNIVIPIYTTMEFNNPYVTVNGRETPIWIEEFSKGYILYIKLNKVEKGGNYNIVITNNYRTTKTNPHNIFTVYDNFTHYSNVDELLQNWKKKHSETKVDLRTFQGVKTLYISPGYDNDFVLYFDNLVYLSSQTFTLSHYIVDSILWDDASNSDTSGYKTAGGTVFLVKDTGNWIGIENFYVPKLTIRGFNNGNDILMNIDSNKVVTSSIYSPTKEFRLERSIVNLEQSTVTVYEDMKLWYYDESFKQIQDGSKLINTPLHVGFTVHDRFGPLYIKSVMVYPDYTQYTRMVNKYEFDNNTFLSVIV